MKLSLKGRLNTSIQLWSFLIPLLIFFLIAILCEVYPFGNRTLLIYDMNNQYVSYFAYFKSIFSSSNDFIYSFGKTLGGDIVGLEAYYLLSPLNLIFLLFPLKLLPVAITVLIALKLALAGLSFSFFLKSRGRLDRASLIFTTAYALMAYNTAYFINVMWLDAVILLPIIALGITEIVAGKPARRYMISLAAAIVINYYTGYMLCIFSAIYFIYTFTLYRFGSDQPLKERRRILFSWTVQSAGAVGLSAFVLLPAIFSLQGGKASFTLSEFDLSWNFDSIDLFSKIYINSVNWTEINRGLPLIYVGTLPLMLVCLYVLNKQIAKKEKLLTILLLTVFVVSFVVNAFNLIWHGFNAPYAFPYRYSFLLSFLLIDLSHRSFRKLENAFKASHLWLLAALFILLSVFVFRKNYSYLSPSSVAITLFMAVAFLLLIGGLLRRSPAGTVLLALMIGLHLAELFFNTYTSVSMLQEASSGKMSSYMNHVERTEMPIRRIRVEDDSFYRMEKTYHYNLNDAMLFSYRGVSHYSSSQKSQPKTFMGQIGFRNNESWAYYNRGGTVAADNYLSVKYILTEPGRTMPTQYESIYMTDDLTAYRNSNALPIGFPVKAAAQGVMPDEGNPFANLNLLYKNSFNTEVIFSKLEPLSLTGVNLTTEDRADYTRYKKIDPEKEAYLEFVVRSEDVDPIYVWMSAPRYQDAEIFVNDESLGAYFDIMQWDSVRLGMFAADEEIRVRINVYGDFLDLDEAVFAQENQERLSMNSQATPGFSQGLTEITSSRLSGDIWMPEGMSYFLLTIPWEEDWIIHVDGKEVKSHVMFDTFIGIEVSPGVHQLDLRYRPKGSRTGGLISLLTLLIYPGLQVYTSRKIKRGVL